MVSNNQGKKPVIDDSSEKNYTIIDCLNRRGLTRLMGANSKNNKRVKSVFGNVYFQYSMAFLLLLVFLVIPFIVFGKTTVYDGDGYNQWFAMFCKWRTMIVEFVRGNGIALWQWDIGLGGDMLGQYTSVIFDPFNILVVFFDRQHMDICYMVTELLKLYFAGLFVTMLVKKRGLTKSLCLLAGISYAFCGWAIAGFRHEYLLMPLITLPLIILGVEKILKKENPVVFIIGIFLSSASSFYFTYMNAILVGLYVIIRYLSETNKKSIADFFSKIWRLIVYAVIGVMAAAVSVIPTIAAISGASKGDGGTFRILPTLRALLKFSSIFTSLSDMHNNTTIIGLNALIVLTIPFIIAIRKKTVNMWMGIITLVFAFFPITEIMMNGLSYPSGRFMYATAMFLIVGGVEAYSSCYEKFKNHKAIIAIWLVFILATSTVATFVFEVVRIEDFVLTSITLLIAIILMVVIVKTKIKKEKYLNIINAIVIVNIAAFVFAANMLTMSLETDEFTEVGTPYAGYENNSLRVAKKINDNEFFRSATDYNPWAGGVNGPYAHVPMCANLYHNAPSNTVYLSTMPSTWGEYNKELLNSAGSFKRMCVYSADNRSRINFLQNVRYYLGPNQLTKEPEYAYYAYVGPSYTKTERHNHVKVYKNDHNASLGYAFDKVMKKSEYLKIPIEFREQALMQVVVVDDEQLPMEGVEVVDKDSIEYENATYVPHNITNQKAYWTYNPKTFHLKKTDIEVKKNKLIVKKDSELARLNFKSLPKGCEVYLKLTNFKRRNFTTEEKLKYVKEAKEDVLRTKIQSLVQDNYHDFDIYTSAYGREQVISKHILYCDGEAQGVNGLSDFMVNMGKNINFHNSLTMKFVDPGVYTFDKIELIAIPFEKYGKQAEKLVVNRLNLKEMKNEYFSGDVNAEKEGILYTSIPYSNGWKAYVDGKEVETIKVDTAFTGIRIGKGHHNIIMKYHSLAWPYTIVASVFGIILTVVIGIVCWRRRKDEEKIFSK